MVYRVVYLSLLKLLHKKWSNFSGNPGFQTFQSRMLCHYTVKQLPIGLHLVITVFPVTPSSTHAAQSLAVTIQSPILIGPSCSSMTQKGVCQSAMWTSTMCVFVLRSVYVCVVMHCHLNYVIFSYFFASSRLLNLLCFSSLLFPLSVMVWCCCLPLSVPLCLCYLSRAAEHSEFPVQFFFLYFFCFCFTVTVYVFLFCFVFWTHCLLGFKIGHRLCLHIFPGRHWVSRFNLWAIHHEGQGHKSSSSTPNHTTASEMFVDTCFLLSFCSILSQSFLALNVPLLLLWPLPCYSFHSHSFYHVGSKLLFPASPLFPSAIPIHKSHPNISVLCISPMELPNPTSL